MSTLTALDYLGVWVFAMSGAFLASKKGMDLFGFIVLALMPAIAGGTIRDIVLDVPVFWIEDTTYLIITVAAALVTFFGIRLVSRALGLLVWFDAVGLAVFCVLGAAKALAFTGDSIVAVTMGVVSAVAGGIVRDVIANETPLVLHKEVYATAAFRPAGKVVSAWRQS
jgi:uncharacterized membrane protein YeiH